MQDKDIRRLFQKAEIQVCPEQKRILKMYEYLQNEIDKNENKKQRKRTEISLRDILWQQFRLIDKTYVIWKDFKIDIRQYCNSIKLFSNAIQY